MKKGIFYQLPDKYKYSASFASVLKPIVSEEKDGYISLASSNLDNLRKFLPRDIDLDKKIDLLPICGNAFVANVLNANDDGVSTKEAIQIASLFPMSYIDLEHDRSKCLGVILNASFSEFGTDKKLELKDIENTTKPFNVVIGGVIWKVVSENIADKIEESNDPKSDLYQSISLSWELAFSEFKLILIDANTDSIEGAKIIDDPKEVSVLETKLKSLGGSGKTESGKRIGRLPINDVIPLGVALTMSPAGDVGSIAVPSKDSVNIKLIDNQNRANIIKNDVEKIINSLKIKINNILEAHEIPDVDLKLNQEYQVPASIKDVADTKVDIKSPVYFYGICPNCARMLEGENPTPFDLNEDLNCVGCMNATNVKNWNLSYLNTASELENITKSLKLGVIDTSKNNQESEKNIETSQSSCVKKDNNNMKLNSIKDITDENLKECKASEISSLLDSEIKKISDDFDNKKKSVEDSKKELESTLASTKETLVKVQEQLNKLSEAQASKEKEERFTIRMASWESEYELDNDDKEIIASDIKDLDDKGYEAWAAKMKKLMKNKKKTQKADDEDKKDKGADEDKEDKNGNLKNSNASLENANKILDKVIENGDKENKEIINTPAPELTLAQKTKKAFGAEEWSVDSRRLKRMK